MKPVVLSRHDLWLDLLKRLTARSERWLVWKNAGSALHGEGDIDSAAPAEDWVALQGDFDAWVKDHDLWPATACGHIPGGLNLVAFPAGESTFLEVSIKATKAFRGATLFRMEQLLPLAELDPEGYRRLRPGAEGVLKLLLNGTAWLGRENPAGLAAKNVRSLLVADLAGARLAASLAGNSEDALIQLAAAVAHGHWDAKAAARVERHFLAKTLADPRAAERRLVFRTTAQRRCPVVKAILSEGRRVPADREKWLAAVASSHTVAGRDSGLSYEGAQQPRGESR